MNALRTNLKKAANELEAAGWEKCLSVMHSGGGLAYGSLFIKDGVRFYLNKDTLMAGFTGPQMADCCKPLFN